MGVVPLGAIAATIVLSWPDALPHGWARAVSLSLALLLMPFVYAIGTGNPLWILAGHASVFWVAAAIPVFGLFASDLEQLEYTSLMAILTLAVGGFLVASGMQHPYRQNAPILAQTTVTSLGPGLGSILRLDPATATYITTLRNAARSAGLTDETQLIDITGRMPGGVYAIGAAAPGTPWLLSGYPGSDKFVDAKKFIVSSLKCAI